MCPKSVNIVYMSLYVCVCLFMYSRSIFDYANFLVKFHESIENFLERHNLEEHVIFHFIFFYFFFIFLYKFFYEHNCLNNNQLIQLNSF